MHLTLEQRQDRVVELQTKIDQLEHEWRRLRHEQSQYALTLEEMRAIGYLPERTVAVIYPNGEWRDVIDGRVVGEATA